MRFGVFGASFDPPHSGHLAMCMAARELLNLDRLIISVSRNPFKTGWHATDRHRSRMAELLAREIDPAGGFAEVSTWELAQPGPSYTVDLLRRLHELHPRAELMLLVGEDSYRDMPGWRAAGSIADLATIVVFGRRAAVVEDDGFREALPPAMRIDFDTPVSSTEIRELLQRGEPAGHRLPPSIAAYIEANGLYRTTGHL
jgi:nicotinate-nucleotide adenylyltransferase